MTNLIRVRTTLTGFIGGPGVATMYFLNENTAIPSVRAFWEAVSFVMPVSVTAQVQNEGDVIESTTGALTGAWSKAPVAPVFGKTPGPYSAPTGAVVNWLTQNVFDGRRLRGRTFIVPMDNGVYETNGTLQQAAINAINGAADALIFEQSLSFVVWHRPREARPLDGSRPAVTARPGAHGIVTARRVPDKVAVLRSRRD